MQPKDLDDFNRFSDICDEIQKIIDEKTKTDEESILILCANIMRILHSHFDHNGVLEAINEVNKMLVGEAHNYAKIHGDKKVN